RPQLDAVVSTAGAAAVVKAQEQSLPPLHHPPALLDLRPPTVAPIAEAPSDDSLADAGVADTIAQQTTDAAKDRRLEDGQLASLAGDASPKEHDIRGHGDDPKDSVVPWADSEAATNDGDAGDKSSPPREAVPAAILPPGQIGITPANKTGQQPPPVGPPQAPAPPPAPAAVRRREPLPAGRWPVLLEDADSSDEDNDGSG
ncbi:hypothetical protein HK405_009141, partial [Cladochytrium tenue]